MRTLLVAASAAVVAARWGRRLGDYGSGLGGGSAYDDSSSSWATDDVLGNYDDSSSSTTTTGGVYSNKATKVLAGIADLENILLKVIHKSLGTVGKLQGYCTDELGMGGDKYLGGYWYEVGSGSSDKKPLYGLEAELAHELKEVGKIVRSKLNLAFGSSKVYSGYSFSFVEAGEGAEGTLSGSVYEDKNGTLGGGSGGYEGKDQGSLGSGSDYKKKYYSSPYGEGKYSSYPVFLPKYSDFMASPWKLDMSYVEDKLSAIKSVLYALKSADYRSLKQIKQLKDTLHALGRANKNCELGSGDYDDSSSSSGGGLGGGADDSSSDSSALQSGGDSSSRPTPVVRNSGACVRARRFAKVAAKLESALSNTLKTEGKLANKLTKLAFTLKEGGYSY